MASETPGTFDAALRTIARTPKVAEETSIARERVEK